MKIIDLFESKQDWELLKKSLLHSDSKPNNNDVNDYINKFKELIKKQIINGKEKDIHGFWRKLPTDKIWESFQQFVNNKANEISKNSELNNSGEKIILRDDNQWLILIPLNKAASCYYGTNTDWCISKRNQNYFEEYFYENKSILIFIINKLQKKKWAIDYHKNDMATIIYNQLNNEINYEIFKTQTKNEINVNDILDQVDRKYKLIIKYQNLLVDAYNEAIKTHNRNIELENAFQYDLNDKEVNNNKILKYMCSVSERVPILEKYIFEYLRDY